MENLSPSNDLFFVRILRDLQTGQRELMWESSDSLKVVMDKARYLDTIPWSLRLYLQSGVDESMQTVSIHNIRQPYLFCCTIALEANSITQMNGVVTDRQRNRLILFAYPLLLLLGLLITLFINSSLLLILAIGFGYYLVLWGEYIFSLQHREKFINQIFELFNSNETYSNPIYKDENDADRLTMPVPSDTVTIQSSLSPETILQNAEDFAPYYKFTLMSYIWQRRDQSTEWHLDYSVTRKHSGSKTKQFKGLLIPCKEGTTIVGEIYPKTAIDGDTTHSVDSLLQKILLWAEVEQKAKEK